MLLILLANKSITRWR